MKADIHPTWFPNATVVCQCGNTWETGATVEEVRTEICSNCHPFYTGEQRIVDTEGRVDKFIKRLQRRTELQQDSQASDTPTLSTNLALSELGLDKRFVNILEEAGIVTAGDVLEALNEKGDDGILGISGIGQQTYIEIKKGLRTAGFELPVDSDE